MTVKAAKARAMLAEQRARLENAIAAWKAQPRSAYQRQQLGQCEKMLGRVNSWHDERTDLMVELALGFMGPNGWAPLLDLLCREAEALNSAGMTSGESERRLSGARTLFARPGPAAGARSSDGSGNLVSYRREVG